MKPHRQSPLLSLALLAGLTLPTTDPLEILALSGSVTTVGIGGCLIGGQGSAIELQYIGDGRVPPAQP